MPRAEKITTSRIKLNQIATRLGHPSPNTARETTLKKWVKLATEAELLGWHSHGGIMTTKPSKIQSWIDRRGHWQMESKVNPENDSAKITARYIIGNERKEFIIPNNISTEERKEYPLLVKYQLKPRFKEQVNKRLLPHMKRKEYETVAKVRFKMKLKLHYQEEKEREREFIPKNLMLD